MRYYNQYVGRFLQADPIGYDDGMNMYAYCGNNSLNFVDPSGNYEEFVSIPVTTVWWNAYSGEYDTPEQHKADVDAYLTDAGLYSKFPGITLKSAELNGYYYDCVFDIPDDLNIDLGILEIYGVAMLNVTSWEDGGSRIATSLIDDRLALLLFHGAESYAALGNGPALQTANIGPFGWMGAVGFVGAGFGGVLVEAGAGTSWSPVGWVIGIGGLILIVVDAFDNFIAVHTNDPSGIPNVSEIEEAIRKANEMAEEIIGEEIYDLDN